MSSSVDFKDATGHEGVNPNHPVANRTMRIVDAAAGLITRTRDKLAIVGYATSSRDAAPYDDPEFDIAGLNQLYRFIPRADVWFDIHKNWEEENVEGTDHRGWLAQCGIPVLMSTPDSGIPTAVRFPIEACIGLACDYFTSSISLILAWGIHQGYKRIDLYGIDLVVGTEYEHQRQCAEFWIGVAHGMGIDINIPPQSALLKHSHRYGYELEAPAGVIPISDMTTRVNALMQQRDRLMSKLYGFDGAIHEVTRVGEWGGDPQAREKWLREQHHEHLIQLATIDGALQESQFYRELATLRIRGADVKMR